MTENFRVGCVVRGRIGRNPDLDVVEGTVKDIAVVAGTTWLELEDGYCMLPENATLLGVAGPKPRSLVGPKPEVTGPIFEAPFIYDGDDCIHDARGRTVLQIAFSDDDFPGTGDETWDAFGKYVAEALSERAAA